MLPVSMPFMTFQPIELDEEDLAELAETRPSSSLRASSGSAAASSSPLTASTPSLTSSFASAASPRSEAPPGRSSCSSRPEVLLQELLSKCGKQTGSLHALKESKQLLREMRAPSEPLKKGYKPPKRPFTPDPIYSAIHIFRFHIKKRELDAKNQKQKAVLAARLKVPIQELPLNAALKTELIQKVMERNLTGKPS